MPKRPVAKTKAPEPAPRVLKVAKRPVETNLRALRLKKNLSQFDLAVLCGIPSTTICFYENGQRSPSIPNLRKIKQALGCSWDALLNLK